LHWQECGRRNARPPHPPHTTCVGDGRHVCRQGGSSPFQRLHAIVSHPRGVLEILACCNRQHACTSIIPLAKTGSEVTSEDDPRVNTRWSLATWCKGVWTARWYLKPRARLIEVGRIAVNVVREIKVSVRGVLPSVFGRNVQC
jgi:hypothetical protein